MYDVIVVGARVAGAPVAMLLARAGHKVLLVDRDTFPSDIMSTHYIHQPGVASLKRWGVLDRVIAAGTPPVSWGRMTAGPLVLEGFGPPAEGITEVYCPRRKVLDKILVDAAVAAGAELREGFSVLEVLKEGERVTGIRGRGAHGTTVTEQARVVVGADGLHSIVARAVDAPRYNEKPPLTSAYYTYWSGAFQPYLQFGLGDGCGYVVIPTNDELICLGVFLKHDQFHAYRADIEGTYFRTLEAMAPELAARVHTATRVERWVGTADVPNFYRKPYGPGWALVGDAGYHKDPITGYGITDAFRDAEWLAEALVHGLSGSRDLPSAGSEGGSPQTLDDALAEYEQKRNQFTMPMYEFICQLAALEPPTPEQQALFGALAANPAALSQFIGVLDGTVSVPEFFADENIGRIMAAAHGAPA